MRDTLESFVPRDQTVIVDSSFEIRSFVPWMDATSMVVTTDAYTLIGREGVYVRSQHLEFERPLVVALTRYVGEHRRVYAPDDSVSKKLILQRDEYTCQYCFSANGTTVDHIIPKSRGGRITWGNTVAACSDCNGNKGDKTPTEAGLPWPVIPTTWTNPRNARVQAAIYATLESMG